MRPARPRLKPALIAVCLIAVGAGGAALAVHGPGSGAPTAKPVALGTATVSRGDLVTRHTFHGKLTYASRPSVHLSGSGTVTSLPHVGQVLAVGGAIAGVDDQPVGILYGSSPLYRTLEAPTGGGTELALDAARADLLSAEAILAQAEGPGHGGRSGSVQDVARLAQAEVGVSQAQARVRGAERAVTQAQAPQIGPDVALVAASMTALGEYGGATDSWNTALSAAVTRWQRRIGAAPTGVVAPADVTVLSGESRVSGVQGAVGDAPSAVTVSLRSSTRVATFQLHGQPVPAALSRGRRVSIVAHGRRATGRVTSVTAGGHSTIVRVDLGSGSRLPGVASAPATTTVTTADDRDVLSVPTQALLALASGGDALQLPGGRLLAVRTGVVDGDVIEVSGAGVSAGLRVVSVT